MIRLLLAASVGYVLGTRAGRERYEQLRTLSKNIQSNPLVAEALGLHRNNDSAIPHPKK